MKTDQHKPHPLKGFSGSYAHGDVLFLLKPVQMETVSVAEKEQDIQSGRKHYSEMISKESIPTEPYLSAFRDAFELNRVRFGQDIAALAKQLAKREGNEIVLVSFARAGTPIGVLLRRALLKLGRPTHHYSLSIIRDRGMDSVALDAILSHHPMETLVFVDGWSGKGAIHHELVQSLKNRPKVIQNAPFCVVSDLAGVANLASGNEDYVIPSAILNGVISGLVSRSILNTAVIGPGDYHGCLVLHDLAQWDLSNWFIAEQMHDVCKALQDKNLPPAHWSETQRKETANRSQQFLRTIMQQESISNPNRIKPGVESQPAPC